MQLLDLHCVAIAVLFGLSAFLEEGAVRDPWSSVVQVGRTLRSYAPQSQQFRDYLESVIDERVTESAENITLSQWTELKNRASGLRLPNERRSQGDSSQYSDSQLTAAELFWDAALILIYSEGHGDKFFADRLEKYANGSAATDQVSMDVARRLCRAIAFSSLNAKDTPRVRQDLLFNTLLKIAENKNEPPSVRVEAFVALYNSLNGKYVSAQPEFLERSAEAATRFIQEYPELFLPDADDKEESVGDVAVEIGVIDSWSFFRLPTDYKDASNAVTRVAFKPVGGTFIQDIKYLSERKEIRGWTTWHLLYIFLFIVASAVAAVVFSVILRLRRRSSVLSG